MIDRRTSDFHRVCPVCGADKDHEFETDNDQLDGWVQWCGNCGWNLEEMKYYAPFWFKIGDRPNLEVLP